jgi:hypothetical protein
MLFPVSPRFKPVAAAIAPALRFRLPSIEMESIGKLRVWAPSQHAKSNRTNEMRAISRMLERRAM